ncbi:hypothetical protein JOD57_002829 [Geodermatophilus bullaregiensis]|nr:hypothetical protein [Geodermatophilus bullaregiensis]MBM7806992.1 hypothetical protein [Geodermatophilus bullaregiensis]
MASKDVGIVDPLQTAANGTQQFFAVDILAEAARRWPPWTTPRSFTCF